MICSGLMGLVWAGPPTKYGHFSYKEAPASDLAEAGRYRDTGRVVRLRIAAAKAFKEMAAAAKQDGIEIIPISGFRSVAYQRDLFARAVKRYGSEKKAAKWVAPPGYSEHATGLAVDLGDGTRRVNDVDTSFSETPAAQWLAKNADRFGFELSFPPNNSQGVNHEPWHWRFVGSDQARALFRRSAPKKI
jgi:D-alanyl-D-alanine carboxypeptidase